MQVSLEVLDGLERRLTVELPAERIDDEVQKRLKKMTGEVRLHGFRPGKVPLKVVKGRFGKSVRYEVTNEIIRDSYLEALNQQELLPAGGPSIDVSPVKEGEGLRYLATFEVYPSVEVANVESFEIKRPQAEIAAEDVDRMIERLRKQRSNWIPVERAATTGDRVTMDFTGFVDDEEFDGGKGTDSQVVLGAGDLIPGFESGLEGTSAGDEKTLKLTFPESYGSDKLAGRDAEFAVVVKEVAAPELPEVDEGFAEAFGVTEGGVDALRQELERNMQLELGRAIRGLVRQQVMQSLLDANRFELPKALVDNEIRNLAEQSGMLEKNENQEAVELTKEMRDRFADRARDRVRLALIVGELIRREDMAASDERLNDHIESMAGTYNEPDQFRKWFRSNARAMETAKSAVLEEQVVDWVLEYAQVSEEQKSFLEIMEPVQEET